ncbi:MAG: phosphatase PAP2 family protein [Candidatus Promineifilaceae bacterium]|nr:phosphatase PAP2 family protein [Candidatus Promineifilaceae bacterium]
MEALIEFNAQATQWLQTNYPQLRPFFEVFTELGGFEFYLLVLTLTYWAIHKRAGVALAYMLLLANFLVEGSKHIVRDPRPFWRDPTLPPGDEIGYGAPSGHTTAATVLYGFLALWLRRGWIWLAAAVIILLMALSRVYLGEHDPADVAAGFILGTLLLVVYLLWRHYLSTRVQSRILGQRLLLALSVPMALMTIYIALMLVLGPPDSDTTWEQYVSPAEAESLKRMAQAFGIYLGASIGLVLEPVRVRFLVQGPLWKRITRFLLGIGVTLLIYLGSRAIIPRDPIWLLVPLRGLAMLVLGLWAAYYAPRTFVWLRLADASPEPESRVTL